jgi:hypothetical protein
MAISYIYLYYNFSISTQRGCLTWKKKKLPPIQSKIYFFLYFTNLTKNTVHKTYIQRHTYTLTLVHHISCDILLRENTLHLKLTHVRAEFDSIRATSCYAPRMLLANDGIQ